MDYNRIICFHNPDEEYGYLSNWYQSEFMYDNIIFSSMEQYMMYQKAMCFNDYTIAKQIMKTNDVAQIKALGREVKNYSEVVWNGVRQLVVYHGLLAKFQQNNELKKLLLSTEHSILAECAVKDIIWGIGISMKDPKRFDIKEWKGENLLGFTLMAVRSMLK